MVFKLPKHWIRWTIFSVAMFMVGLIIAYLLLPAGSGIPANTKVRLTKMGGGQSQAMLNIVEERGSSLGVILAAVGVILAVVGYGYYREKKRRRI